MKFELNVVKNTVNYTQKLEEKETRKNSERSKRSQVIYLNKCGGE